MNMYHAFLKIKFTVHHVCMYVCMNLYLVYLPLFQVRWVPLAGPDDKDFDKPVPDIEVYHYIFLKNLWAYTHTYMHTFIHTWIERGRSHWQAVDLSPGNQKGLWPARLLWNGLRIVRVLWRCIHHRYLQVYIHIFTHTYLHTYIQ